ncbi:Protein of unknown function [Methanobrevibacter olleyae]|uniref:DUF3467 domain-containing protein n=2 Tax=Methanobrevibacter olleyae TaxID=294671 RepID=A0A1I4IK39_METOL|nr:DUF3467 domain-containing protein [Methanobrevibacter olleyae]SFL54645.1 Protein of unknown function [Methanobrevibacter olleyae]
MNEEKKELNLFIPEDLAEYYITGGAIASSPFDIRLILFKDEIEKNNDILNGHNVGMIRTAKTEIIISPVVAKQLRDLLDKELQKYEDD